jgi:hypothetical protein
MRVAGAIPCDSSPASAAMNASRVAAGTMRSTPSASL